MVHPDNGRLAARISVSSLHKSTCDKFTDTVEKLYSYRSKTGENASLIAEDCYQIIMKNADKLNATIDYSRDMDYDFFGFKTLEKSYLLKVHGIIVERPQ
jgi:ribonucleoside-diphosphate reductase alpha chain